MRYTIRIAAAVLAASFVSAFAPPARAAKPAAKPAISASAAHSLNLSDAQKKKLLALHQKAQAEATAVQKGKGTEAQKRQKILAIAKKYDALEMKVLTPDQQKKVRTARAEQKIAEDRTIAVSKTLTPAQKKKIEGYRAAFMKKIQALDADKKLTPQQKQAKFVSYRGTLENQVRSVLTAKQRAMIEGK